jgi:CRP-like cAMP-binding protein
MVEPIMNAPLPNPLRFDIQGLINAVEADGASDNLNLKLSAPQWDVLASYLQPFALAQGQSLIEQGAQDRTLYFVETGSLSVHYEDTKGRVRLAILGPGAVVGEGAFFSRLPRSATVQAAGPCKAWCLAPMRFTEMSNRQPEIALNLVMALGSVLSRRLIIKPKRVAVT